MKTILIIGATSKIAQEFALASVKKGYHLILAARNQDKLNNIASDLQIRTNIEKIETMYFDTLETGKHKVFFKEVLSKTENLKGIFIAAGVMFDQKLCENDFLKAKETIDCNFTGIVSILNIAANFFEEKNVGFLSCITSVAGDRGRKSNYIYAATKAALNVYLQGLRNRLGKTAVLVQTVKCGPVDTPMTKGMKNLPFLAQPAIIATAILKGIEKRKEIIYLPKVWFFVMKIICAIPERIFKRMNL